MPFDPNIPQPNTPADADQMRDQLNALNDDIQQRATQADLANAIAGTSSNSNGVATLGFIVSDPPTQAEMQSVVDKVDELINALRR